MDHWSEDSSDEYVRAEQEAALYSVVHYREGEAEANALNEAKNHTSSEPAFNPSKTKAKNISELSKPEHISNQPSNVQAQNTKVTFINNGVHTSLENKSTLNTIGNKEVKSTQSPQETNFDSNCTNITTFSFNVNKLNLPKPVKNDLFSPFNAKYLESKTSSEQVFRLDERLFSRENDNRQETSSDKPRLAQDRQESSNTLYNTNVSASKTEAQKAFVFNLSSELNSAGNLKPQVPTSAPTLDASDHNNTLPTITKVAKKIKSKKKLKILQSNVLYNSLANLNSPADKVMVIGLKHPESKCEVIVRNKKGKINSKDPEVIVLDSDSDESVRVVSVPIAPVPVIISVEDSSDDDRVIRMRPAVVVPFETDPNVAENSFDFLDNAIVNCMDDFDGIRKAQANVLSSLISNYSSKESLVDERLFQVDLAVPEQENSEKRNEVPFQEDNVSSSTSSVSPVLENDQSVQTVGSIESGSDTGEPKTPSHSFKVPKSKVRTKSRQTKNATNLPAVVGVVLSSSDTNENDDLLVVHSGTKSTTTIEEILSGETNIKHPVQEIVAPEPVTSDRKRKREESKNKDDTKKNKKLHKKIKKSEKKEKKARIRQECIPSQPRANLVSYTKIAGDELVSKEKTPSRSPPTWTKEMRRFYNTSWGGEDHDWKKIKASMSGHPFAWQVMNEDRYPVKSGRARALRCRRCERSGHFAWNCPDLITGTKCRVCGQLGHAVKDCPNSICLKCGQPSQEYLKCCWQCKGSSFGDCMMCIWQHSPAQPCKNYRAPPTPIRQQVSVNAGYKGYRQRYGNNQRSERGFNPYYNKNFSRRPYR